MVCGVQPSEIMGMEAEELMFWLKQAARINGTAEP